MDGKFRDVREGGVRWHRVPGPQVQSERRETDHVGSPFWWVESGLSMDSGVLGQIPALWSACRVTSCRSLASSELSTPTVRGDPHEGLNRLRRVVCNPLKDRLGFFVCFWLGAVFFAVFF